MGRRQKPAIGAFLGNRDWIRGTVILGVIVASVTLVGSLLWPKSYRAEAKILPNPSGSPTSSLMGLAAASGIGDLLSGTLGGSENPVLTYPEILSSRALLERVALSPFARTPGKTVMNALGFHSASRQDIEKAVRELGEITRV